MNHTKSSQDRDIDNARRTASSIPEDVSALITIIEELDAKCDELTKEIEKLTNEITELKNTRTE